MTQTFFDNKFIFTTGRRTLLKHFSRAALERLSDERFFLYITAKWFYTFLPIGLHIGDELVGQIYERFISLGRQRTMELFFPAEYQFVDNN